MVQFYKNSTATTKLHKMGTKVTKLRKILEIMLRASPKTFIDSMFRTSTTELILFYQKFAKPIYIYFLNLTHN